MRQVDQKLPCILRLPREPKLQTPDIATVCSSSSSSPSSSLSSLFFLLLLFSFAVLAMEARALHLWGINSATELHPQPQILLLRFCRVPTAPPREDSDAGVSGYSLKNPRPDIPKRGCSLGKQFPRVTGRGSKWKCQGAEGGQRRMALSLGSGRT